LVNRNIDHVRAFRLYLDGSENHCTRAEYRGCAFRERALSIILERFVCMGYTYINCSKNNGSTQYKQAIKILAQPKFQKKALYDVSRIKKITTLFTSIFWLTHLISMSSLCQKPQLLPYLRNILYTTSVISYTKRHENMTGHFAQIQQRK